MKETRNNMVISPEVSGDPFQPLPGAEFSQHRSILPIFMYSMPSFVFCFSCLGLCLSDPFVLCVSVSHLFPLLSRISMHEYATGFFFPFGLLCCCFLFWPSQVVPLWHSGTCLLVNICTYLCWVWSGSKLNGSRGGHMLSCGRHSQTGFQNGCTN